MTITKRAVNMAYNEIERRLAHIVYEGAFGDDGGEEMTREIEEYREAMLQGLYSTFMMIADNWPEVRHWCDVAEAERGYYKEDIA